MPDNRKEQDDCWGKKTEGTREAIKFTRKELGLNQYDFEGSMVQSLEQFFRKFGGTLTPYYAVRWEGPLGKLALGAGRFIPGLRKLGGM